MAPRFEHSPRIDTENVAEQQLNVQTRFSYYRRELREDPNGKQNTLGKDALQRRRQNVKRSMQNLEQTRHDRISFASPFFFQHLSAGVTRLLHYHANDD